jgi:hypothetical protein
LWPHQFAIAVKPLNSISRGVSTSGPFSLHDLVADAENFAKERRTKLAPLLDQLSKRGLSFRQFAYLSRGFADRQGDSALSFNHVSVSHWFSGKRNPSPEHRQVMAALLGLSLNIIDEAFDHRKPLTRSPSPTSKPARIHVFGSSRVFQYSLTIRSDLDLNTPAVYEGDRWEDMFCVYPADLRRHLNRGHAKLYGWIPDDSFKPLIPYSQCLVQLNRPRVIPSLSDSEGINKRIWFIALPSGAIDIRFLYRDGMEFVTSKPNHPEQRLRKDAIDPLGCATGSTLFRLELLPDLKIAG